MFAFPGGSVAPNKKCPLIPWDEEAFLLSWFHPPAARDSDGMAHMAPRESFSCASLVATNGAVRDSLLGHGNRTISVSGWRVVFAVARSKMALTSAPALAVGSRRLLVPLVAGCIVCLSP